MSHFSVLVIGDLETSLAPFSESDEEYFKHVPISEESISYAKSRYLDLKDDPDFRKAYPQGRFVDFVRWWTGYYTCAVYTENNIDWDTKDAFIVTDETGNEFINMYYFNNPDAKWDWYTENGRFDSSLKFKGSYDKKSDEDYQVTVADVDFSSMIEDVRKTRGDKYDNVIKLLGHRPNLKHWDEFLKEVDDKDNPMTIELAREEYHNQKDVKKFAKDENFSIFDRVEAYDCTREEYIAGGGLPYFAIVYKGRWYSRGDMGWWACVSNEKSAEKWHGEQRELIEEIERESPDEPVYEVDCHI